MTRPRLDALRGQKLLRHEIVGAAPALTQGLRRRCAASPRAGARAAPRRDGHGSRRLFARAYAAHTPARARGPYVPVTIPALAPRSWSRSCSATSAAPSRRRARDRRGRLEIADGGVLFLDEVGDIDPASADEAAAFLDSGELFRVGTPPRRGGRAGRVRHQPARSSATSSKGASGPTSWPGSDTDQPSAAARARARTWPALVDHFLWPLRARRGSKRPSRRKRWHPAPPSLAVQRASCSRSSSARSARSTAASLRVEDLPEHLH